MVLPQKSISLLVLYSLLAGPAFAGTVRTAGAGTPLDPSAAPANVLLVSLDTLRADHLGTYGYRRKTSPEIDAIATRGVVFERAVAPAPGTPPSHMSLFTSTLSCIHGIDGSVRDRAVSDQLVLWPEILQDAGYATGAFTENGWVTPTFGFDRGFDVFVENTSPDLMAPTGQAEKTFSQAIDWIDRQDESPWFAFVHTYQVHDPYAPPPGMVEKVAPDHAGDRDSIDRANYDAEIFYTDGLLGDLVRRAEAASGDRPILVILFSDHGELFGEHGARKHSFWLYEELLHVPLIFYAPRLLEARRIDRRVALIDVLPTVLDLLGLAGLPQAQGRSLDPLLRGGSLTDTPIFAEMTVLGRIAAYSGNQKSTVDLKQRSADVVDLATDPSEDHPRKVDPLAGETLALVEHYERLCATPPSARRPGKELTPEVRRKLEALGYLETPPPPEAP